MVTQAEQHEEQRRIKARNKIIQGELDFLQNRWIKKYHKTKDVAAIILEAYHLGMDTGIKIGKDDI